MLLICDGSRPRRSPADASGGILSTTVLVVEDFEPFRQFVCTILQSIPGIQVACELANGLQAVERSAELQPDLILLDIGLPGLDGIEAARRIRKHRQESKIIFLSMELSAEVVREALATGAVGYVAKPDAAGDLLIAVQAVLRGDRFIGSRFEGHDLFPPTLSDDAP
jgi:DNA-binding NarL/FixJ family response regulator